VGIFGDCPLEVIETLQNVGIGSLAPEISPTQIELVCLGIDRCYPAVRALHSQTGQLWSCACVMQVHAHFLHRRLPNAALQFQQIAAISVITLRPKVSLVTDLNELRRDAGARTVAADAAFQYVLHAKFTADLIYMFARILVAHYG